MLEDHIIEPVQTERAAPMIFATMKNGSLRFPVDCCRHNAVTKRDVYPKPRMDEFIDSLVEAAISSTLDAKSAYWQVEIDEANEDRTELTSHHGLFRLICIRLSLRNAPGTFRRTMYVVLLSVR